jgi:hypothetical protein
MNPSSLRRQQQPHDHNDQQLASITNHHHHRRITITHRYRRLSEIQIGTISDVVVRVISYDQTRTIGQYHHRRRSYSYYGSNNNKRHANPYNNSYTKTQTTCLLSDGPRDVDHVPLIMMDRSGSLQHGLHAMLQRHYEDYLSTTAATQQQQQEEQEHNNDEVSAPQQQQQQQQGRRLRLLRLTHLECQSHHQWHHHRQRHRPTRIGGRGGVIPPPPCQLEDGNNDRILVPTRHTQAMACWENSTNTTTTTTTQMMHTPRVEEEEEEEEGMMSWWSAPLQQPPQVVPPFDCGLDHGNNDRDREPHDDDNDQVVILHHSPLLDITLDGVSLLTLPVSKWMNVLLVDPTASSESHDDDDGASREPTFRSAILTLQTSMATKVEKEILVHSSSDRNGATTVPTTTGTVQVMANSNIVQTLCGGLSAKEFMTHAEYPPLATQLLTSLVWPSPPPSVQTNHDRHHPIVTTPPVLRWSLTQRQKQQHQHERVKHLLEETTQGSFEYQVQQVTLETFFTY